MLQNSVLMTMLIHGCNYCSTWLFNLSFFLKIGDSTGEIC